MTPKIQKRYVWYKKLQDKWCSKNLPLPLLCILWCSKDDLLHFVSSTNHNHNRIWTKWKLVINATILLFHCVFTDGIWTLKRVHKRSTLPSISPCWSSVRRAILTKFDLFSWHIYIRDSESHWFFSSSMHVLVATLP